jgi:eukaryotic-like serine/threonine-protein kinase
MMNPANLIGKTLDQFRLDEYIGRGAMGVVYKATDTVLRRSVALKLIPKGFEASTPAMAEARKRLIQEAQAAGCLTHPNIVTIHAYGETDEFQYICMEYIVGKTLAEVLNERKILPIEEAVPIVEQVLMALDRANQEGIVHRDIKPANIMILEDKRVKVMDFGIAKIPSLSTTTTGTVLGTPYYMSPEQISGQKVDILSDIFSVGAVFYQIITGTRPFEGETTVTLAYKIVQVEPVPARILNIHIPQEIDNICKKALAKDPSIRYQTPIEMLRDLRAFMAKGATAKRPAAVVSPMLGDATVKTQAPILPPRQEPLPLSEDRTIPIKDIPYTKPAAVEVKPEVVEKRPPESKPIPPVMEKKAEPAPVPPVVEKKPEPVPPLVEKKPVSTPAPPAAERKPEPAVITPPPKKETVPPVLGQRPKPSSAQDNKPGSSSKTIAIVVAALLVLGGGGYGLVRYLRSTGPAPESTPAKPPQVTQNVPKRTEPTPPPAAPPTAPPTTATETPSATPPATTTPSATSPETPPVTSAKAKQDALVLKAKNQIKSNPANARKLLDQVLTEAPDHFEATYQLARLLTFQKDFQSAIQTYQKAQQLNKKMPEIPFNLGFIFMSQGDFDQAITYYEQCRNLKPRFLDEVLTNEGFCFLQKNNQQKAKTLFAEAIKVNPKNRIARNYLKNNGGQP